MNELLNSIKYKPSIKPIIYGSCGKTYYVFIEKLLEDGRYILEEKSFLSKEDFKRVTRFNGDDIPYLDIKDNKNIFNQYILKDQILSLDGKNEIIETNRMNKFARFSKNFMCYKMYEDRDKRAIDIVNDKQSIYYKILLNIFGSDQLMNRTFCIWAINTFTDKTCKAITYINGKRNIGKSSVIIEGLRNIFDYSGKAEDNTVLTDNKKALSKDKDSNIDCKRFHILDETSIKASDFDRMKAYSSGNRFINADVKFKSENNAYLGFYHMIIINNNANIEIDQPMDDGGDIINSIKTRINYIERQDDDVLPLSELINGSEFKEELLHKYMAARIVGVMLKLENNNLVDKFISSLNEVMLHNNNSNGFDNLIKTTEELKSKDKSIGIHLQRFFNAISEAVNGNNDLLTEFMRSDINTNIYHKCMNIINNDGIKRTHKDLYNTAHIWCQTFGAKGANHLHKNNGISYCDLKNIVKYLFESDERLVKPGVIGLKGQMLNKNSLIIPIEVIGYSFNILLAEKKAMSNSI